MEDSAIREWDFCTTCAPARTMTGCTRRPPLPGQGRLAGGINATWLFSVLYHRTLNIGRASTLFLIVQREAEIDALKPVLFYTVALTWFTAASARMDKQRRMPSR